MVEHGLALGAGLSRAQTCLVECCGHYPLLEQPERTAIEMREFFGSVGLERTAR